MAVDWSMVGCGGVGEEAGILAAATLTFLDVDGEEATAFDDLVFTSYLAGMRSAGWQGDARMRALGTQPRRDSPSGPPCASSSA